MSLHHTNSPPRDTARWATGGLFRQIAAMHQGTLVATGLEGEGLVARACFELHVGGQLLLARRALGGLIEESQGGFAGRRRVAARIPGADRLGDARLQQLWPHLAEQAVRRIDLGAVELPVDGEDIADD